MSMVFSEKETEEYIKTIVQVPGAKIPKKYIKYLILVDPDQKNIFIDRDAAYWIMNEKRKENVPDKYIDIFDVANCGLFDIKLIPNIPEIKKDLETL